MTKTCPISCDSVSCHIVHCHVVFRDVCDPSEIRADLKTAFRRNWAEVNPRCKLAKTAKGKFKTCFWQKQMEDGERGHREGLVWGWQRDPGDGGRAGGCWGGGVEASLFAPLDTLDISGWNSACKPLLGREILSLLCQNPTRQPCIWLSEVDKRLTTPRRLYATTFTPSLHLTAAFLPTVLYLWPGPSLHDWQWTAARRHRTSGITSYKFSLIQ